MTGFYDSGGEHLRVYKILIIISSVVSSLASLVLIYLIYVMKLRNGFTLLILSMTMAQLIYDATFVPAITNVGNANAFIFINVLQLLGGQSAAIFSNFLTFVIFHVIKYKKSLDIYIYFPFFLLFAILFFFLTMILYIVGSTVQGQEYLVQLVHYYIYYYFRLCSIFFNFITCGLSYLYIFRMNMYHNGNVTVQDQAIYTLVYRMQFYPIFQAISRSGAAW